MTILVTGAASGLGLALAGRLLAEGRAVRLLTRRPYRVERFVGEGADIREWHPANEALPAGTLDGVVAIAHLLDGGLEGPHVPTMATRAPSLRRVGADRILTALAGHPVRLIMASSVAIYDDIADVVCTEASAACTPRTALQVAALDWEAAAAAARAAGASVAVARLGLVTGSDTLLDDLADRIAFGARPALGKATVPLIDLDDAVALLVGLIDNPEIDGPINGVAPEAVTGEELVRLLGEAIGDRSRLVKFAGRLVRGAPRSGCSELLTRRSRVVPRRLTELNCVFTRPDAASCLARVIVAARARHADRIGIADIVRGMREGLERRLPRGAGRGA